MSKYELISVILSLLAITISFYVYFKNNRFSTTVNTTNITISIGNAYNAFIQARQAHTVLSDGNDSLSKDVSIAYQESKDSYLLTLDHACFTYFKHHLDHEYFDTTYKKTISRSLELNNKELKKTLTIIKSSSIRCFGWILFLWILTAIAIAFTQILRL